MARVPGCPGQGWACGQPRLDLLIARDQLARSLHRQGPASWEDTAQNAGTGVRPVHPCTAGLAHGHCLSPWTSPLRPGATAAHLPEWQWVPGGQSAVAVCEGSLPHCCMDTGGPLIPPG
jgi:hypothetical protein